MRLNRKTATIAGVVAFCVGSVVYSQVATPDGGSDGTVHTARYESPRATPSPSATHAAAKPTPSAQPSDLPRLDHQGDGPSNCVLRYRAGDHGTAGWAVFASRAGTVELTATTTTGKSYEKSWYADTSGGKTVYVTGMNVPVPLTALKAVEGTLVDAGTAKTYRCLVGPEA